MFYFERLHERYANDPEFHQLVDIMENVFISQHGFTPLELRQAVFLACVRYGHRNVEPFLLDGGSLRRMNQDERIEWNAKKHASLDPDF